MKKEIPYKNTDVKCNKCHASVKINSIVKLKDRYCCPNCFATIDLKTLGKRSDKLDG